MNDQQTWEKWLPNHQRIGDEVIHLFIRRHWFTLFSTYLFIVLLFLAPILVYVLTEATFPTLTTREVSRAIIIMITSIYYLFLWMGAFTVFIDYYLDIWIVTNHRIVDIEQRGLFNHIVSEQTLEQVQDVSSTVKGVFATFLGFGDVLVQSAGAKNLFHFRQIPSPDPIARTVNQLAEEYREKHRDHIKPAQPK